MTKKKHKFSFIMMTCGYVESASTSWLMFGTHFHGSDGFETRGEALRELAVDLYSKYYDDYLSIYERRYARDVKDCCRNALIKDKAARFCSDCGNQIKDKEFDEEAFMEFVTDLHNTTCDSYGEAEFANSRHLVWWPWSAREFAAAPKESVIWILESAEHVMLDALYDAKPELRPADSERGDSDYAKFKNDEQPSYT